jgi:hypothetical protein
MSKAASHFRENDVKRLVRSVERAGVKIGRVELQGGKVILFPDNGATVGERVSANEWDGAE